MKDSGELADSGSGENWTKESRRWWLKALSIVAVVPERESRASLKNECKGGHFFYNYDHEASESHVVKDVKE